MKIAYFDCFAGAAGDMIVAAMLDAGLDAEFLKAQLTKLDIENLDIKLDKTKRAGLEAASFVPVISTQQHHRNLKQITEIISQSKINKQAAETAITIFNRLAAAEALVHGKVADEVEFHELGATDSIIDIVCACVGLVALGIEKVYCSPLSVGGGSVKCTHGILPVPAPATAELLKGIPIAAGPEQIELLTPTAAAILTTVAEQFGPLPPMKVEAVGYGAGTFQSEEFPNVLRLILGQTTTENSTDVDSVCLLETNIDDVSGELIGLLTEQMLGRGALDVFTTPIYMKHNRPAVGVSVVCRLEDAAQLQRILFQHGLTFGIRKQILARSKLVRDSVTVTTEFGKISIKTGSLDGRVVAVKPEFSDCVSAAEEHNQSVKAVLDAAMAAYAKL